MAIRPFYWARSIERVHIAILDMFDNIVVRRRYFEDNRLSTANEVPPGTLVDDNGYYKVVPVPLYTHFAKSYASYVYTTQNDPQQGKSFTPSIGIRLTGISRNLEEQPPPTRQRKTFNDKSNTYTIDMQPIAYIFRYELAVYTELFEDTAQILENIYPYFNTWRTARIKEWLNPDLPDAERDIKVQLNDSNMNFNDGESLGNKRSIEVVIPLEAKAFIYRMPSSANMIESVEYANYIGNIKDRSSVTRGYKPLRAYSHITNNNNYSGGNVGYLYSGYSGINGDAYYSGYSGYTCEYSGYNGYSGIDLSHLLSTTYSGYSHYDNGYSGIIPIPHYTKESNNFDGAILVHTEKVNDWTNKHASVDSYSSQSYRMLVPSGSIIAATSIKVIRGYDGTSGASANIQISPVNDQNSYSSLQSLYNINGLTAPIYINNPINTYVPEDSYITINFDSGDSNIEGLITAYISWLTKDG